MTGEASRILRRKSVPDSEKARLYQIMIVALGDYFR